MAAVHEYWLKVSGENAGLYKSVTLASRDINGDPARRELLLIVESLEGGLTEAFNLNNDVGRHWRPASQAEVSNREKSESENSEGRSHVEFQWLLPDHRHYTSTFLSPPRLFRGDAQSSSKTGSKQCAAALKSKPGFLPKLLKSFLAT